MALTEGRQALPFQRRAAPTCSADAAVAYKRSVDARASWITCQLSFTLDLGRSSKRRYKGACVRSRGHRVEGAVRCTRPDVAAWQGSGIPPVCSNVLLFSFSSPQNMQPKRVLACNTRRG